MVTPQRLVEPVRLGATYLVAAGLTVALTRYDGGVAFLWLATAVLAADLMARPRQQWLASIVACGVASILVTGFIGLGWAMALPFALINLSEAVIAAWLLNGHSVARRPLGSLAWLLHFVLAVGVVAPLCAGLAASLALTAAGRPFLLTFGHFVAGHSLGNLAFTPIALLLTRNHRATVLRDLKRRDLREAAALLLLAAATFALVFLQEQYPILFLPMLPMILIAFRVGRGGVALSIALLAILGGMATARGHGPIQLLYDDLGDRMQFFQMYLAATVLTLLPVTADLENRARLHRKVRESEAGYRLIAEFSTDIIVSLKLDGTIRYISPACRELGYEPRELIGRNCMMLVAPDYLDEARRAHGRSLRMRGETTRFEYQAQLASGELRWCESHARLLSDDKGQPDGILTIVRDISARKGVETSLTRAARVDPLTGLDNRLAYREAIGRRRLHANEVGDCVALLDIDHFKRVNDRYGHDAGDEVLRGFAQVARRAVREQDIVARVGGEEFAIYFPNTLVEQALAVCERLRLELAGSVFEVGSAAIRVTVSGGVAKVGAEGVDRALKVADMALYRAKTGGRNQLTLAA